MKRRWRVTFSVDPNDPVEIHSLEVDADTKADAIRTALESIRVASVRDSWGEISVRELTVVKE